MTIEKILEMAASQGLAVVFCLLIYREQIAIRKSLHHVSNQLTRFFMNGRKSDEDED